MSEKPFFMPDIRRDPELKLAVEEWMAPPPSAQLQSRTLAAFDREFGKTPWWRIWTAALVPGRGKRLILASALGSCALLLMVARAFPQMSWSPSLPAGTKWTVDSELIRYADDGTPSVEMQMTSYESNSNEVLISRSVPGNGLPCHLLLTPTRWREQEKCGANILVWDLFPVAAASATSASSCHTSTSRQAIAVSLERSSTARRYSTTRPRPSANAGLNTDG
jgi:hypothetical protein